MRHNYVGHYIVNEGPVFAENVVTKVVKEEATSVAREKTVDLVGCYFREKAVNKKDSSRAVRHAGKKVVRVSNHNCYHRKVAG